MIAGANLALRFLLELCGIAAAGWWGYQLLPDGPMRFVLAILAAGVVVGFWAVVVAPKATNSIPPTQRVLIGSVVLILTALALAMAGQPLWAVVFAVLILVNTALMLVLDNPFAAGS